MLRAGRELKPDVVVILGDFADFYSVSSHSKRPDRASDLKYEVERVKERLREVAALGARRNVFVSGNHEDRLERYLMDRAPALFGAVKIPEVLDLSAIGFEWVPYRSHAKIGKLFVTHDTGNAGAYAHYKAQASYEGNVVIGHTHRIGYAVSGTAAGDAHVGAMLGWLGDVEAIDYMHRIQALRAWAHGFGVGYMEPDGVVHIQPVPIIRGRCVVAGRLIS